MKNKRFYIMDFVAAAVFLALFAVVFVNARRNSSSNDTVYIQAGKNTYAYSLKKDGIYYIPGKIGESVIKISGGTARFADSPCENKSCVLSGKISHAGEWAACLPNGISIRIDGSQKDLDATAK